MRDFLLVCAGLIVLSTPLKGHQQEIVTETDNIKDQIVDLNQKAALLYDSVPELSFQYANQAMNLATEQGFEAGIAEAHLLMGKYYGLKLIASKQIHHYSKALALFITLNDSLNTGNTYKLIGGVYALEGLIDKMLENLNAARAIYAHLGNNQGIGSCYFEMGRGYYWIKDYSNSTQFYLLSLAVLDDSPDSHNSKAGILNNLGVNYLEQKNFPEALRYFRQSYVLYEATRNLRRLTANYHNCARALMGLGEYDSAMIYAIKSHDLSRELDIDAAVIESSQLLAELYAESGNYPEAYKYQMLHSKLVDSVRNAEAAKVVDNFASALEIEEANRQIEIIRRDQIVANIYRNIAIGGFMLFLFLSSGAYFLWMGRQKRKQAIIDVQKKLADARIENLSLRKKSIEDELEFKYREVAAYSVNAVQKNTVLKEIREIAGKIAEENQSEIPGLQKLMNLIDTNFSSDKSWEEFKESFENVHQDFFARLKEMHPDITSKELEHCALVKLNRNLKETASIMGISPDSVKMARHRLKKKLNLKPEESLVDYLIRF